MLTTALRTLLDELQDYRYLRHRHGDWCLTFPPFRRLILQFVKKSSYDPAITLPLCHSVLDRIDELVPSYNSEHEAPVSTGRERRR